MLNRIYDFEHGTLCRNRILRVMVNLSASQVEEFQKAIDNNKKIEAVMEDVRNLSREILDLSTQGVIRRKCNNELKNP